MPCPLKGWDLSYTSQKKIRNIKRCATESWGLVQDRVLPTGRWRLKDDVHCSLTPPCSPVLVTHSWKQWKKSPFPSPSLPLPLPSSSASSSLPFPPLPPSPLSPCQRLAVRCLPLLFSTLILWVLNMETSFPFQLYWLACQAHEYPAFTPPLGLQMSIAVPRFYVDGRDLNSGLFVWTSTLPIWVTFSAPKEFLNQVWNQLNPWDRSWFLFPGTYIFFLRRETGVRKKALVKICLNLFDQQIAEVNNRKFLIRYAYINHSTCLCFFLNPLLFWTPNIFRSLRYSKAMHLGTPIHYFEGLNPTHMFVIYL